ncbi:MAG: trigger factor [Acidiferrobacterales bacterium]|nr:trigger factor [Acidiferrobacterales bacterium]
MDYQIEIIDSCARSMTIVLERDKVDSEARTHFQDISKNALIPGFRKGKVPIGVLQQRYGNEVLSDVIRDMTARWIDSEMQMHEDNRVIGYPEVDGFERNEQTRDYDVRIKYEVMPVVETFDIKGCSVVKPIVEVGDEDVDEAIENWLKFHPKLERVDRPAAAGDWIWVQAQDAIQATQGNQSPQPVHIWLDPDECDKFVLDACIGKGMGEMASAVMPNDAAPAEGGDADDSTSTVQIQIIAVEEPVPDSLNDSFLEWLEVDSAQDENLHAAAKKAMSVDYNLSIDEAVRMQVMGLLLDRNPFRMPNYIIHHRTLMRLMSKGIEAKDAIELLKDSKRTREAMSLYLSSAMEVKSEFLLNTLREHYEIEVDEEQIQKAVENEMQQVEADPGQPDDEESSQMLEARDEVQMQEARDEAYSKHAHLAMEECNRILIARLLESADCDEVEMTFTEYDTWREDLHLKLYSDESDDDIDESENDEADAQTSVILDSFGNPIERQ